MPRQTQSYTLQAPTWDALERLAHLLGTDADAVLSGTGLSGQVNAEQLDAVVKATCAADVQLPQMEPAARAAIAQRLVDRFAASVRAQLAEVKVYSKRLEEKHPGMTSGGGDNIPLGVALTGLEATEYQQAAREWPLAQLLKWLIGRSLWARMREERQAAEKAAAEMKKRL